VIKVYIKKKDTESEDIIDALKELVVAHDVEYVETAVHNKGKRIDLPAIVDDDRLIQGKKNIMKYLDELGNFLEEWQKFQSDACYCDPEGNVE
jgi:hypothetical protein